MKIEVAGEVVTLSGQLDERADLSRLVDALPGAGRVIFDLAGVSYINSMGVREWTRMLYALRAREHQLVLRRCSEPMVNQLNMIVETRQGTSIESFFTPYYCPKCGHEASVCLEVAAHRDALAALQVPETPCPQCAAPMLLNELPERYLLFLST